MALPSFLPFFVSTSPRFHPSSSFIRHFLYRSRVTFLFFFLLFSLISLLFSFLRFFSRSSSFINRLLSWLFTVEYIALFSISSQFLRFYRPPPSRCSVHGTALIIRSLSSPFSPSSYNAWNDFLLCTPIHICTLRHLSYFSLTFALVMTEITNILNFLLRFVHLLILVFDYAFYNLLKIFNFFKKLNFFKSNERKIIYLERLLYRITSFSVRDLFLKNRILQAILAIQPVCFTCMMKK